MRFGLVAAVSVVVLLALVIGGRGLIDDSAALESLGANNVAGGNVMIKGYDPVAYFSADPAPQEGDPDITAKYDGVVFQFADEANRQAFVADPERYLPKYGGFCSYGVRMGQKLDIDPNAFRVIDGKLYLQLDLGTRHAWMLEEAENIRIADNIWPQIRDGLGRAIQ